MNLNVNVLLEAEVKIKFIIMWFNQNRWWFSMKIVVEYESKSTRYHFHKVNHFILNLFFYFFLCHPEMKPDVGAVWFAIQWWKWIVVVVVLLVWNLHNLLLFHLKLFSEIYGFPPQQLSNILLFIRIPNTFVGIQLIYLWLCVTWRIIFCLQIKTWVLVLQYLIFN